MQKDSVRGLPLATIYPNSQSMRLGVVMRRTPGVTRWAQWAWKAVCVLPGAGDADWKLLRAEGAEGDVAEYHAATLDLTLYVSDTEAYAHELDTQVPSVYIVQRREAGSGPAGSGLAEAPRPRPPVGGG